MSSHSQATDSQNLNLSYSRHLLDEDQEDSCSVTPVPRSRGQKRKAERPLSDSDDESTGAHREGKAPVEVRSRTPSVSRRSSTPVTPSGLKSSAPKSIVCNEMGIRAEFGVPAEYRIVIPTSTETPLTPPPGFTTFFVSHLRAGLRIPVHEFFQEVSFHYAIPLWQFTPNSIKLMTAFAVTCLHSEHQPDAELFYRLYLARFIGADNGSFYLTSRGVAQFLTIPPAEKGWRAKFFYAAPPEGVQWTFCRAARAGSGPNNSSPVNPLEQFEIDFIRQCNAEMVISVDKVLDDRVLYHYGLSPLEVDLQGATIDSIMDSAARAPATLERKKARLQGKALPPASGAAPSAGRGPAGSGEVPPASQPKPKSAQKSASDQAPSAKADEPPSGRQRYAGRKHAAEEPSAENPTKRSSPRLRLQDAALDVPLSTDASPAVRTTRSQGDPPESILKSKEFHVMRRFLKDLANSSDRTVLDATPTSKKAETAIMLFPKVCQISPYSSKF